MPAPSHQAGRAAQVRTRHCSPSPLLSGSTDGRLTPAKAACHKIPPPHPLTLRIDRQLQHDSGRCTFDGPPSRTDRERQSSRGACRNGLDEKNLNEERIEDMKAAENHPDVNAEANKASARKTAKRRRPRPI
ncbi:unnamed protein product [Arctogadus glacialis]